MPTSFFGQNNFSYSSPLKAPRSPNGLKSFQPCVMDGRKREKIERGSLKMALCGEGKNLFVELGNSHPRKLKFFGLHRGSVRPLSTSESKESLEMNKKRNWRKIGVIEWMTEWVSAHFWINRARVEIFYLNITMFKKPKNLQNHKKYTNLLNVKNITHSAVASALFYTQIV